MCGLFHFLTVTDGTAVNVCVCVCVGVCTSPGFYLVGVRLEVGLPGLLIHWVVADGQGV